MIRITTILSSELPATHSHHHARCRRLPSPSPPSVSLNTRPERMAENLDIFDFELDPDQIAAIDALDKGEPGRVGPNPDTYQGV